MATLDSSSAAESSMDDGGGGSGSGSGGGSTNNNNNNNNNKRTHQTLTKQHAAFDENYSKEREKDEEEEEDEGDPEVWETFNKSFKQVQSVLDRNRYLINQVNENHQSKIPNNLVKNVALIQEINGNISKVASLYSDLSSNFSSVFHHRNESKCAKINANDISQ